MKFGANILEAGQGQASQVITFFLSKYNLSNRLAKKLSNFYETKKELFGSILKNAKN